MSDRFIDEIFKNRQLDVSALQTFGFHEKTKGELLLTQPLAPLTLIVTLTVTAAGQLTGVLTDPETATPYVLHVSESQGRYVAKVRKAYTSLLTTIAEQCSHPQVFTSPQAQAVIAACADQFDSHPEFLWARTPNNAIFRKASNQKWFAALLTVPKNKVIGTDSTPVELIDVRVPSDQLTTLVDHQTVFPGYHMNKQHWVTVLLDGSMATERLLTLIAASYELAVK